MSFSRGLKAKAAEVWEAGYQHPFVQEIGQGTLDKSKFQFYLLQDYHYLLNYAKVFALAAVKADDELMLGRLTAIQSGIFEEMDLHRSYMAEFGITPEQVRTVKQSLYNRTYTANMLAVGQTGDLVEILATVFPCAWTYYDLACRLKEQYADRLEGNFYKSWIESYSRDEFLQSFEWFYDVIDELVEGRSEVELEKITAIFVSSVEFEYLFWDMAYKQEMSYRL